MYRAILSLTLILTVSPRESAASPPSPVDDPRAVPLGDIQKSPADIQMSRPRLSLTFHPPVHPIQAIATVRASPTSTFEVSLNPVPNLRDPGAKPDDPSCPDAGAESHGGCDDPIRGGHPFDLWELARSWTPGFCGSSPRMCGKKECAVDAMVPALTLHGMWPSYATPVDEDDSLEDVSAIADPRRSLRTTTAMSVAAGGGACFWPQMCTKPTWFPKSSPWTYDPSLLPQGTEYETLAPAWYSDSLGSHEWPKHGTCAAWADETGTAKGLDQKGYYDAMFTLAAAEGTPKTLVDAMGGSVPLKQLQDIFGGAKRVALGCTPRCELVQVLTCYAQGEGTESSPAGPGERADCPCTGVRDSHYDNSCAEAHACAEVKILSPEQTGCGGGGPKPGPGPAHKCTGDVQCCPGVKGPSCSTDADCGGQSGCDHCAHSGFCTDQVRPN